MEFQRHLFISYAHIDNVPLSEDQQGWITRFHNTLSAMLNMRMGRKAEIWRDSKLQGNDIFADEIVQQFPRTALLISVLTPRYAESEWCTREVREFCKCAEASGGLVVDNKCRVLKVIKLPVDNEELLPAVMREALGYPFYVLDEQQTPFELDPAYGEDFTRKYNLKLAKLAFDVAQLVKKIETPAQPQQASAQTAAKPLELPVREKPELAIYLAECSFDRREAREALESELRLHGYPVFPDIQLPKTEEEYTAAVSGFLARCQLSIHLVGTKYGLVPDGPSEKSVVVLQNELAIERYKQAGLRRVISLPEGTNSDSASQRDFIARLLEDAELQAGADLVTGDVEELKGVIHAALKKLQQPEATVPERQGNRLVYLICDQRDRSATIPVRKFLKGRGFDVQIPLFEGDAATVRQTNQDLIAECDAAILFYGAGDEGWQRSISNELKKATAYRGAKQLPASFIYLAEPATESKQELIELEEPNLINGLQGFSDTEMLKFARAIEPKSATA
ncbi:MAG: toll/interleukin-1 receptor domain-containing protein [Candidatus Korobacteraceae bacterium]